MKTKLINCVLLIDDIKTQIDDDVREYLIQTVANVL